MTLSVPAGPATISSSADCSFGSTTANVSGSAAESMSLSAIAGEFSAFGKVSAGIGSDGPFSAYGNTSAGVSSPTVVSLFAGPETGGGAFVEVTPGKITLGVEGSTIELTAAGIALSGPKIWLNC